jgi:hypothetical protein
VTTAAATASATAAPTTAPGDVVCTLVQRLQGGLGNQLFQIAFARKLARASGAALAYDIDSFGHDAYGRVPLLHRLLPDAPVLRVATLPPATTRLLPESAFPLPASGPMPARFALPAGLTHLVLDGYWQDHRFVDADDAALLGAALASQLPAGAAAIAERIRAARCPVSLHVRRHDYKHHGLCAEAYYLDTLAWLQRRHGALDLFVFSDEPNYTRHLLRSAGWTGQMVHSGSDVGDLHLMALCRHHVISNSSYSWWGALLSGSDDVVCPAPWSFIGHVSPQLCPPHWRRVQGAVEQLVSTQRFTDQLEKHDPGRDDAPSPEEAPWTNACA